MDQKAKPAWNSILDTKLDTVLVVADLVDKNKKKQEMEDYIKFKDMYDVVKQFVIEKHLVLYGGTALNEILPEKSKFYPREQLPDYDFFSYSAKEHAKELGDLLLAKGYNYIEVKSGIHPGTYKVFAEFQPVADVTDINRDFYEYMVTYSVLNNRKNQSDEKLVVSPFVFLKWSLYSEMCRIGSIHRWEKLVPRYKAFHQAYKLKRQPDQEQILQIGGDVASSQMDDLMTKAVNKLHVFVRSRNYPVVGMFGTTLHMAKDKKPNYQLSKMKPDDASSYLDILTLNLQTTFAEITQAFEEEAATDNFKIVLSGSKSSMSEIVPYRCSLMIKVKGIATPFPFCRLLQVEDICCAVQNVRGYKVGTPDTILQYLYAFYMVYGHDVDDGTNAQRMEWVKQRIITFERFIDRNLPRTSQRLTLECFGKEKTLLDIRKDMWGKKLFVYRPKATNV